MPQAPISSVPSLCPSSVKPLARRLTQFPHNMSRQSEERDLSAMVRFWQYLPLASILPTTLGAVGATPLTYWLATATARAQNGETIVSMVEAAKKQYPKSQMPLFRLVNRGFLANYGAIIVGKIGLFYPYDLVYNATIKSPYKSWAFPLGVAASAFIETLLRVKARAIQLRTVNPLVSTQSCLAPLLLYNLIANGSSLCVYQKGKNAPTDCSKPNVITSTLLPLCAIQGPLVLVDFFATRRCLGWSLPRTPSELMKLTPMIGRSLPWRMAWKGLELFTLITIKNQVERLLANDQPTPFLGAATPPNAYSFKNNPKDVSPT